MPITTPQGTLDFKKVDRVTFVGASSNTVIDTTTGSLGVGVDGNGPTSKLHVVGNTRLEGDINMLHTSNTASIKLNSNVVAEFPRSKKLIKYPRVALTANSSGGYVSSASTVLNSTLEAWYVFDMINPEGSSVSRWRSADYVYTNNSAGSPAIVGTAAQLSASSGTPSGEYILVTLPEKMCLKRYSWSGLTTQGPKDGEIWGSNDGSSWSHVHTFTDGNSGWVSAGSSTTDYGNYPDHRDVGEGNVAFYSRYAFIITKLAGGDVAASMRDLQYFGTPEYDPEAHGTDVTVKSVANVPNTDWLEVYYDGRETSSYSGLGTTVNDLAGTQQNGTFNGGFDPTYKAFTFNGTSQNMTTTLANSGTPSAYAHTFAFWTKPISNLANHTQQAFLQLGTHSANSCSALRLEESTGLFRWFFHTNDIVYSADHIILGEWNHIVAAYDGGSELTSRRIWVNDKEIHRTTTSGTIGALSLSANAPLSIGSQIDGSSDLNGSIANFRLFNRALTSDEIYQLYAYQKEDFGHGDLSMTLKAGRLGIGTSEPRAMLDVRGDIYAVGSVNPVIGMWKQSIDSATVTTNILTNIGSCVSTTTLNQRPGFTGGYGIFTAPYDGIYQFQAFLIGQSSGSNCLLLWGVNGPSVDNNTWNDKNLIDDEPTRELFELRGAVDFEEVMTFATLLNMSKGDNVNIQNHSNSLLGNNDVRCSAFLLHRFN